MFEGPVVEIHEIAAGQWSTERRKTKTLAGQLGFFIRSNVGTTAHVPLDSLPMQTVGHWNAPDGESQLRSTATSLHVRIGLVRCPRRSGLRIGHALRGLHVGNVLTAVRPQNKGVIFNANVRLERLDKLPNGLTASTAAFDANANALLRQW